MEAIDYSSEELRDEIEKVRLLTEAKESAKVIKPLVDEILGRDFRYSGQRSSDKFPSWDADTYRADTSGKTGDYTVDGGLDSLWERHLSGNDSIHEWINESIYDFVGDKKSRNWNWGTGLKGLDDRVYDYTLWHTEYDRMVLVSFDEEPTDLKRFEEIGWAADAVLRALPEGKTPDLNIALSDAEDLFDLLNGVGVEHLKKLIIFCNSLDGFNASESASYEYNYRRSEKESDWQKGDFSDFSEETLYGFLEDPATSKSIKRKIRKYLRETK